MYVNTIMSEILFVSGAREFRVNFSLVDVNVIYSARIVRITILNFFLGYHSWLVVIFLFKKWRTLKNVFDGFEYRVDDAIFLLSSYWLIIKIQVWCQNIGHMIFYREKYLAYKRVMWGDMDIFNKNHNKKKSKIFVLLL